MDRRRHPRPAPFGGSSNIFVELTPANRLNISSPRHTPYTYIHVKGGMMKGGNVFARILRHTSRHRGLAKPPSANCSTIGIILDVHCFARCPPANVSSGSLYLCPPLLETHAPEAPSICHDLSNFFVYIAARRSDLSERRKS